MLQTYSIRPICLVKPFVTARFDFCEGMHGRDQENFWCQALIESGRFGPARALPNAIRRHSRLKICVTPMLPIAEDLR